MNIAIKDVLKQKHVSNLELISIIIVVIIIGIILVSGMHIGGFFTKSCKPKSNIIPEEAKKQIHIKPKLSPSEEALQSICKVCTKLN